MGTAKYDPGTGEPTTMGVDANGVVRPLLVGTDGTLQTNASVGNVTVADGVDVDLALINDVAVDVNSGNKSAGTLRVVLATDQPALTNPLSVVYSPLGQATMANSLPVTIASNQTQLPWTDAAGSPYTLGSGGTTGTIDTNTIGRWMALHLTANASANTVTWESSIDASTWRVFTMEDSNASSTAGPINNTSTSGIQLLNGSVPARYVRVRVSTFVGGTTTFGLSFHPTVPHPNGLVVETELPTPAALADTVTNPTTTVVGSDVSIWDAGAARWNRALGTTGVLQTEHRNSFSHIASNTTTTSKSGAGVLHAISINTKGITNTATVYDNTAGSGTVIAILDTTLSQDTLIYDVAFATGLTIVTAGGTAADMTVAYR